MSFSLLKKTGIDGFIVAIIISVLAGYYFPQPGVATTPINLKTVAAIGVSFIFFFYGLKLSKEKLKQGLANWKMHLIIHLGTFILFPVFILLLKPLFPTEQLGLIWLGVFFLAALPSTVSSSVVMVSIARGNVPAAIFNASLSSLLGIFLTPLLIGLFVTSAQGDVNTSKIITDLFLQVLMPVIAGILLQPMLGKFVEKHPKTLQKFDQSIILLIIYTSFSHSFANNLFQGFSFSLLAGLAIGMALLFFFFFQLFNFISNRLNFSVEDKITTSFCGTKKSLVHGTVMANVLFSANTDIVGIILLPIMLYHIIQLFFSSILANKYKNR